MTHDVIALGRSAVVPSPSGCPERSRREVGGLSLASIVDEMAAILGSKAEARDLLALMHEQPRHWALTSATVQLNPVERAAALSAAWHRANGAPSQYAACRAAFRHLMLLVDERVLIPRPETELLVDIVLDANKSLTGIAVDVGTGSGAIALSLASEGTFEKVIGIDVSLDALNVARENAARCNVPIELRLGSLLGPIAEKNVSVVVSNPPYIAFEEATSLPASVRDWEPSVALYSSNQGMDATCALVREAAPRLAPRGLLAIEVDTRRASLVAEVCAAHGAYENIRVIMDLTGRERFVAATRREE